MKQYLKISLIILIVGLLSCKKDKKTDPPEVDPIVPIETGSLTLNFENNVDSLPLVFGQKYINANGDTFTVSKFNYIISNIVLTKNDNSTFTEANSYHIIRHSTPGSSLFTLGNVPTGSYKAISFMIGVDSITNASGAKTGALDLSTAIDMYWEWSTGYIALKFEGSSPQAVAGGKSLVFHLGGYGGINKAQRSINLSFENYSANVSKSVTPLVHLSVNVKKLFESPNKINFASQYFQMSPDKGTKVFADNYAKMIEFEKVTN
jgi:hypothetical protein